MPPADSSNIPGHPTPATSSGWRRGLPLLFAVGTLFACAIAATMFGSRLAEAQADLPGVGITVQPRLMIVFDTSRSMQVAPQDDTLSNPTLYSDDWDPNNPTANCRNKFCIGKKVLSQVLPSYTSLIKMGLASYYQYQVTTTSGGTTTPANTTCRYDILAAPGEKNYLYFDINAGSSFDCSDNYNACTWQPSSTGGANTNTGAGVTRTCNANSSNFPNANYFSITYYSDATGGSTLNTSTVTGSHQGSSHAKYSTNTHNITYTLRTISKDAGPYEVAATGTYASPVCPTPQTAGATYTVTSGNSCSSSNPCKMYFNALRLVPETNSVYCQYYRYKYVFNAPGYQYYWSTAGGELVGSFTVNTNDSTNWCATPSSYVSNTGFGANKVCPPRNTTSGNCSGSNASRQCLLKWRKTLTISGKTYNYGRDYQANSSSDSTYCMAPDRYPTASSPWFNEPDPGTYVSDWCTGTNQTTSGTTTSTKIYADYYDPTNIAGGGVKPNAWSLDSSGNPALVFVNLFGTTSPTKTMADILSALSKYNATTNPTGLRWPDVGDLTPLYGALQGATQYLGVQLASDPDYLCRRTYLLFVTDGEEQTPVGYTATQLVDAVTALRSLKSGAKTTDVHTFVVGFGQSLTQSALLDQMARAGGTAVDDQGNVDLVNGHAFSATDQTSLTQNLSAILTSVAAGFYTRSRPVLTQAGDRVYVGYFGRQSGQLEWPGMFDAFNLAKDGTASYVWQAGATATGATAFAETSLSTRTNINNQTSRALYTNLGAGYSSLTKLDTAALSGNTTAVQTAIYGELGTTSTAGDSLINFMKNMSNNAPFNTGGQTKSSRLSDIYHSMPVLVGAPPHAAATWGNTAAEQSSYATFITNASSREQTLYVGANDGLVHAVREDPNPTPATWAGSERWAFAPNYVLPNLSGMLNQHTFSVDGSFVAEDICTGACATAADWHTMLVATLRDGGAALEALDVTDPANPKYMWEFRDGNLGATYSTPAIGRVHIAAPGGGSVDKWVVIVGGGDSLNTDIGNWVYVLDATTGQVLTDGTTSAKFQVDRALDVSTPFPNLTKNNLAGQVAIYRPNDYAYVNRAYLGDTQGRLSRVFMDQTSVSSWKPVRVFDPYDSACQADIFGDAQTPVTWADASYAATYGSTVGYLPLQSTNTPPPIFHKPTVSFDIKGRAMIYLGTGDTTNPTTTDDVNFFYAMRDNDQRQACSATPAWVKQFAPGEKVLGAPAVVNGVVFVATYIPPTSGTGCNVAGDSKIYAWDALTGTPQNVLVQLNPDGSAKQSTTVNGVLVPPPTTSSITLSGRGMLSDLVYSGNKLVASPEIAPTSGNNGASAGLPVFPVKLSAPAPNILTWRRIQ